MKFQQLSIPRHSFGQIECFLSSESVRKHSSSLIDYPKQLCNMEEKTDKHTYLNITIPNRKRSNTTVSSFIKDDNNCRNLTKIILRCTNREKSLLARKRVIR